jgi:aspartyl-tRNA(Asn)/glutamyl-tRNA(Gln) amidotransferase subunit A
LIKGKDEKQQVTVFHFSEVVSTSKEADMSQDILKMTAVQLREHFADKQLSPVEVATAMLDQIERVDKHTNGFCLVDRETTLGLARDAEQRYQRGEATGLLDGVPVAVKDVFLTPMWPTIKGSHTLDPQSTMGKSAPCAHRQDHHARIGLERGDRQPG